MSQFRWIRVLCGLALASVLLCGCRSVPPPRPEAEATAKPPVVSVTNQSEAVFNHFPKEWQKFSFWQKCNPVWWLGNANDPVPPENYRVGKCCRQFTWRLRNPCHNFTFYVIGIEDKPHTRVGRFPSKTTNPNGGWNWAVSRYKRLRLPFVDYKRRRFEFYCGWRSGGNFGMKLNFSQGKPKKPEKT